MFLDLKKSTLLYHLFEKKKGTLREKGGRTISTVVHFSLYPEEEKRERKRKIATRHITSRRAVRRREKKKRDALGRVRGRRREEEERRRQLAVAIERNPAAEKEGKGGGEGECRSSGRERRSSARRPTSFLSKRKASSLVTPVLLEEGGGRDGRLSKELSSTLFLIAEKKKRERGEKSPSLRWGRSPSYMPVSLSPKAPRKKKKRENRHAVASACLRRSALGRENELRISILQAGGRKERENQAPKPLLLHAFEEGEKGKSL